MALPSGNEAVSGPSGSPCPAPLLTLFLPRREGWFTRLDRAPSFPVISLLEQGCIGIENGVPLGITREIDKVDVDSDSRSETPARSHVFDGDSGIVKNFAASTDGDSELSKAKHESSIFAVASP